LRKLIEKIDRKQIVTYLLGESRVDHARTLRGEMTSINIKDGVANSGKK